MAIEDFWAVKRLYGLDALAEWANGDDVLIVYDDFESIVFLADEGEWIDLEDIGEDYVPDKFSSHPNIAARCEVLYLLTWEPDYA